MESEHSSKFVKTFHIALNDPGIISFPYQRKTLPTFSVQMGGIL